MTNQMNTSRSIDFHPSQTMNIILNGSSASNINEHKSAVDFHGNNACCFCKRHFSNFLQLYRHVKSHFKEENNEKCQNSSIGKYFETFSDKYAVCKFCDQKFEDAEDLKNHESTHLQGLLLQCGQCQKKFINQHKLCAHYKPSETLHICDFCSKYFCNSEKYSSHLAFHDNENHAKKHSDECIDNLESGNTLARDSLLVDGKEDFQDFNCEGETSNGSTDSKQQNEDLLFSVDEIKCEENTELDVRSDEAEPMGNQTPIIPSQATDQNTQVYKCSKCDKVFKWHSSYKRHRLSIDCTSDVTCKNNRLCHICKKACKTDKLLKKHMLRHCNKCNKLFTSKSMLLNHQKTQPNCFELLKCGKCEETFKFHKKLDDHVKLQHPGENLFKCPICAKEYAQKAFLRKHLRRHNEAGLYKCSFCEKSFNRKDTLLIHERVHTGECPYRCDVCEKSYKTSSALSHHKKSHTGEKPYACKVCIKAFSQQCLLKYHELKHVPKEERLRHQCDICGKSYSEYGSLTKHLKYHSEGYIFKCDQCDKCFATKIRLENHYRSRHTHEKPFECPICNKRFPRSDSLNTHKVIHTGVKPYKCDYCEKSFFQNAHKKNHERIHTGERPYMCKICGLWLITNSALHSHMRTHKGLQDT